MDRGICLCWFVPRATHPLSSTSAGAEGGCYMDADGTAPVTHLAENKKKGRGEGVRWSVYCVMEHALWGSQ